MNLPRHLANHNRLHQAPSGVWIKDPDASFGYSDGEEAESYIAQTITQAVDRRSLSTELASQIRDWSSEYHLSPLRSNLLRALNLDGRGPILEIGAGCGAITRYLGELNLDVDAVEGSYDRACIARLRCADLENVEVHAINVNDLSLPDKRYGLVCFIGVLEYAQRFSGIEQSPEEAVLHLLEKAKKALRPDGAIVIAIENRLGFKYLFGAGEDHYGLAYEGIHDYPHFAGIKTYSKTTWEDLFSKCDLAYEFLYPFPDYKLPEQVLSDHYVQEYPQSWSHVTTSRPRDYHGLIADPGDIPFWETMGQANRLGDFADSFLIVAANHANSAREIANRDFIHVSNLQRQPQYRTLTEKLRGRELTNKRLIDPSTRATNSEKLIHLVPLEEPFHAGIPLANQWEMHLRIKSSEATFLSLMKPYYAFIETTFLDALEQRNLIDLTPMNIMVMPNGSLKPFDLEWQTTSALTPEFILFRGLFYFLQTRQRIIRLIYRNIPELTIGDVISRCFGHLGLNAKLNLTLFSELEESLQNTVHTERPGPSTEYALQQRVYPDTQQARLFWTEKGSRFESARYKTAEFAFGVDHQSIKFCFPYYGAETLDIRFIPGTTNGYCRLHSITTSLIEPDNETVLHALHGGKSIAQGAQLDGLIYGIDQKEEVFLVNTSEASLTWQVRDPRFRIGNTLTIAVTIEMDWVLSSEFRLIRSTLLHENARLARELAQHKENINRLIDDIQLIRQSRVMRTAERVKGFLLYFLPRRFLSATPNHSNSDTVPVRNNTDTQLRGLGDPIPTALDLGTSLAPFPAPAHTHITRTMQPKISVVLPVHNPHIPWIHAAIDSVKQQTYGNWELCIVDDYSEDPKVIQTLRAYESPEIRIRELHTPLNISGATNEALRMASGEYIVFLDHDDVLTSDALTEVVAAINNTQADIVYSDEDLIDLDGSIITPHFKSDYSPDLLLSHNYITHLVAIRRILIDNLGGLRSAYDGAQDYDLLLRLTDDPERTIHHIPKILYHWRKSDTSTSLDPMAKPLAEQNARNALTDTLRRRNIDGVVKSAGRPHFFTIVRAERDQKTTIIIPFRDQADLLRRCITSILNKTTFDNYEVIGISNNSTSPDTFSLMQEFVEEDTRIRFLEHNQPFNFSELMNLGFENAAGKHIVSVNNDIEIISWDWLAALLQHSQRPEVGVVGGKLFYPNGTIQHAGIILGVGGYAGHSHKGRSSGDDGYYHRASLIQNVSAVTGAFMMFDRHVFEALSGFDTSLATACNDVDFCLRALEAGYLNVYTPNAQAYHLESATRGYEDTPEKLARFQTEVARFQQRHRLLLSKGDPYYNINLSLDSEDFEIASSLQYLFRDNN